MPSSCSLTIDARVLDGAGPSGVGDIVVDLTHLDVVHELAAVRVVLVVVLEHELRALQIAAYVALSCTLALTLYLQSLVWGGGGVNDSTERADELLSSWTSDPPAFLVSAINFSRRTS